MMLPFASLAPDLPGILPALPLPDPQASIRLHSGLFTDGDGRHPLSHCFHCITVSPSPEHPTRKRKTCRR